MFGRILQARKASLRGVKRRRNLDFVFYLGYVNYQDCDAMLAMTTAMSKFVKTTVFVPTEDADKIRKVLGDYSHTSFSFKGKGRFKPEKGADPAIGR